MNTEAAATARDLSTDALRRICFTEDGASRHDEATLAAFRTELLVRR